MPSRSGRVPVAEPAGRSAPPRDDEHDARSGSRALDASARYAARYGGRS